MNMKMLFLTLPCRKEARDLGIGLSLSLSASSSSLSTAALLLLSYTLSSATYDRVRPSLFVSFLSLDLYKRNTSPAFE